MFKVTEHVFCNDLCVMLFSFSLCVQETPVFCAQRHLNVTNEHCCRYLIGRHPPFSRNQGYSFYQIEMLASVNFQSFPMLRALSRICFTSDIPKITCGCVTCVYIMHVCIPCIHHSWCTSNIPHINNLRVCNLYIHHTCLYPLYTSFMVYL